MECPEPDEITRFVQGDLARERAEAIEVHLDDCQSCAMVVSDLVKIWSDDMVSGPGLESAPLLPSLGSRDATLTSRPGDLLDEFDVLVLPSGAEVGPYRVLDVVGIGGMGVVYSAYDPELDRRVALKVLRTNPGVDASRRNARLQREAQAMAKLSHPNVITVHHVGRSDGRIYIAMEFVDGETLGAWMKRERRRWREIRDTFAAAGEGLRAAHEAGLVHRDFKPENVLIGRDGRVRVTDFGLARFRDDLPEPPTDDGEPSDAIPELDLVAPSGPVGPAPTLTRTGALVGTPAYMAPEQYEGRRVTAATDQFAFCVAMFEAIYGERPFKGDTLSELAANVCAGNVTAKEDGPVPGRVARALRRGLSVSPEDRFPTMGELLEVINRRPSHVVRRWAMVTIPSLLVAAGMWGYRGESSAEIGFCRDAGAIETVWQDDRRQSIEEAFMGTELPYAEQAAETVLRSVETYTVEWESLREQLCREGLSGLEAGEVMTIRCLLDRRAQLDTLLGVFESADEAVVNRAISAIQGLEPAPRCLEADITTSTLKPPTPREREEVEQIREQIARALALADAGKLQASVDELETLAARASTIEYAPLRAEVKYALGRVVGKVGHVERAEELLEEASWIGVESGHREVSAEASIELVFLRAARLDDVAGAREAKRAADAFLKLLGDEPKLRRRLLVYSGTLALMDQEFEEARAIYERVLATDPPEPSVHRATLLMNLGSVQVMLGQPENATDYYRRAVEMFVEQFGKVHPRVANGYYNLGVVLSQQGILDDAVMQFETAYELEKTTLGVTHPQHAETTNALGAVLLRLGQTEEGLGRLEEAVDLAERGGTTSPERLRAFRITLASALGEAEQAERAEAILEDVRADLDRAKSRDTSGEILWWVASAQLARRRSDYDAALAASMRAAGLVEDLSPGRDLDLAVYVAQERAWAEAGLGRPQQAVAIVQTVLDGEVLPELDAIDQAEIRFQQAQHLRQAGREAKAREQALLAHQIFDDAALFDETERVAEWLGKGGK